LRKILEPGKHVKADEGYRSHPDNIKCPRKDVNLSENWVMQGRVRAHHKTLNGRLKTWEILSQVFRHHITMHGNVFWACKVVMQLTIENGGPLFELRW
jgi:hypothetical protein